MAISPRASEIGLPALRASSSASSSSADSIAVGQLGSRSLARSAGAIARQRRIGGLRARDGGVGLLDPGARDLLEHRLRRGLDHLKRLAGHSRSNPRKRSQSVTAAWNASSSTSAMLR